MNDFTQEQRRFPLLEELTVRDDFEGDALSSGFVPLPWRRVDRKNDPTQRLAAAFQGRRYPSYLTHPLQALFMQCLYQIACAYEDR